MEEVSQIGNRNDHYKGWQVSQVHKPDIFILNSHVIRKWFVSIK